MSTAFQADMSNMYSVTPAQLKSHVVFQNWDLESLQELISKMEPVCFPENRVIIEQGDFGKHCYFYLISKVVCARASCAHHDSLPPVLSCGTLTVCLRHSERRICHHDRMICLPVTDRLIVDEYRCEYP